ncbi:MAG: CapA family protein [Clostridiales bacterium]|jgi:poly-gamma-glutamate synthesis protein (capsule biosynthesis protein)|nr:CapA family protein [Clostridiales bacterium]
MKRLLAFTVMMLLLSPLALARGEGVTMLFSFAGDTTLGGHEGWMDYSKGTFKVMAQEQGYGYFLKEALPHFSNDDLTMLNLEGVLADSGEGQNKNVNWNFRGTTDYAAILTLGSVEAVTLGNNHTADYGEAGLKSTKDALDAAGILYSLDDKAFIFEKDGVKVGFMGFTASSYVNYKALLPRMIADLKEKENCSAVVLQYHGGKQYRQTHNNKQTEDMRYAVDSGADLVIGHHPHVLQGMEIYQGRTIVYSLGDFCYGGNRKPRESEYPTMVLQAALTFEEGGRYQSQQLTIHPYQISATRPRNNYQPYPVFGDMAEEVLALIQKDTPFTLNPFVPGLGAVQERVFR